jgi:ribonuclease I
MTMARLFLLILIAGAAAAPQVKADSESAAAGSASGWIADYFWSPQYCREDLQSHEPQCIQPHGFVIRELIRKVSGVEQEHCDNESISRELLDRAIEFTFNMLKTKEAWDQYGKCGGVNASEYVGLLEYINRKIQWPDEYDPTVAGNKAVTAELAGEISQLNPGLNDQTMVFQCNGPWLEKIQICMDSDFKYDKISCPAAPGNCGDTVKFRPYQSRLY